MKESRTVYQCNLCSLEFREDSTSIFGIIWSHRENDSLVGMVIIPKGEADRHLCEFCISQVKNLTGGEPAKE